LDTQKTRNKKTSNIVKNSFILSFISKITDFIYSKAQKSQTAHFLLSKTPGVKSDGFFIRLYRKINISKYITIPIKRFFNASIGNSFIISFLKRLLSSLIDIPIRVYGVLTFSFGFYTALSYIIAFYAFNVTSISSMNFYIGIVLLILSIPLLISKLSLYEAVTESLFLNILLFKFLGISKDRKETEKIKLTGMSTLAFILGMVLGISTVVVNPIIITIALLGAIGGYIILVQPEVGVVITIFALPFLPTMAVALLTIFVAMCYFIKYIQGKRSLNFELVDLVLLVFIGLVFFGGIVSFSESGSLRPALMWICLMFGYFVIVNLIRTVEWTYRCVSAILASSFIVSAIGVFEYFFGSLKLDWIDENMFGNIEGRVVSTFANPNVLAEYLILTLPLAVALFLSTKNTSLKATSFVLFSVGFACLIFTWSRGAWIGFIFGILVFMIIYSRKSLMALLFCSLGIPFLPFVLPESITQRFLSIGNLGDSSTSYRFNIWKGAINMLKENFIGGIGIGPDAFSKAYVKHSLAGIESAPHSHNLFLEIAIELGIMGLITFLVIIILHARHNMSFLHRSENDSAFSRMFALGSFCGMLSFLVQGMTDYTWYNYRLFYMFWIMAAINTAIIRSTENERTYREISGPYLDIDLS